MRFKKIAKNVKKGGVLSQKIRKRLYFIEESLFTWTCSPMIHIRTLLLTCRYFEHLFHWYVEKGYFDLQDQWASFCSDIPKFVHPVTNIKYQENPYGAYLD